MIRNKYKKLKYTALLIVPLISVLIWFLYFELPDITIQNNSGNKYESPVLLQKKEINPAGEKQIDNSTLSSDKDIIKIKRSRNKNKPVVKKHADITIGKNEPLNIDTLEVQKIVIERETESSNISDNKVITRAPPIIREIPEQIISWGQKFPDIDLKQFVLDDKDKPDEIKWQLGGNKYLYFSIDKNKLLSINLPADDWYGSDTLSLEAFNSANKFSSAKIVFQIKKPDLINRYPIRPIKNILVTGVEDMLSFTVNPLQWKTDDYLFAASVIGGTFLLTRVDSRIQENLVGKTNYENNTLMNIGKFYGETSTSQYTSLGITFIGLASGDDKITRIGLEVFESFLIADRLTNILKYAFGRDRPSSNNGALNFNPFPNRGNNINSLPSGHTTNAFALSTVLSSYTDNIYFKILIYSPAFLTAVSRIYQNYHWTSDVFLGGAIGYVVGSFLVNRHNKIISDRFSFLVDQDGRIAVIYKF